MKHAVLVQKPRLATTQVDQLAEPCELAGAAQSRPPRMGAGISNITTHLLQQVSTACKMATSVMKNYPRETGIIRPGT